MPQEEMNKSVVKRKDRTGSGKHQEGLNYLFVIAIEDYQHCPRLYNCVQDATKFIEILTTKYNFQKEYVRTLLNDQATEGNIIREFRDLAQNLTEKDNLVIFFSGHGEYDAVFDEGYWIPVDAKLGAQEDFLSNSDLKKRLNAIKSRHTFLIADSCFSGSLFTQYKSAKVAERLEETPSRWGLTSGRNEVVSDGKPGDHSPFAESLIYHLEQNKGTIGVANLCNLVIENVVANADQTPRGEPLKVSGHKGGQLFFHPKINRNTSSGTSKNGRILYDIPPKMEVGQNTRCLVRIAFEDIELLKGLKPVAGREIQAIKVSDLMEVEILDPLDNDNFLIRSINEKEQLVDVDDYTQWMFYLKALRAGTFPLLLKVTVIEMLYGKERRKEIVLEETVTVVTELKEPVSTGLKNAGYTLRLSPENQLPPAPGSSILDTLEKIDPSSVIQPGPPVFGDRPDPEVSTAPAKSRRKNLKILGSIAVAFLFLVVGRFVWFPPDNNTSNPDSKGDNNGIASPDWQNRTLRWININGKFGFKDAKTGEIVIKPIYDNRTNFKDGVAFVKLGEKWGLINKKGETVVPFIITQPGRFENGKAEIMIGTQRIIINTKGETRRNGQLINVKDYFERRTQ